MGTSLATRADDILTHCRCRYDEDEECCEYSANSTSRAETTGWREMHRWPNTLRQQAFRFTRNSHSCFSAHSFGVVVWRIWWKIHHQLWVLSWHLCGWHWRSENRCVIVLPSRWSFFFKNRSWAIFSWFTLWGVLERYFPELASTALATTQCCFVSWSIKRVGRLRHASRSADLFESSGDAILGLVCYLCACQNESVDIVWMKKNANERDSKKRRWSGIYDEYLMNNLRLGAVTGNVIWFFAHIKCEVEWYKNI